MYALHIAFEHRRMLACLDMQCLPGGSLHSHSQTHAMSWQPHKIKRFTAYMNVCVWVASVWHGRLPVFVCVCQTHMMQSNRQYEVHTCIKQVIPFWGFWIINATKNVRSSIYCCCVLNCILHCALVMGITAHFTHTATHTHMHTCIEPHRLVRLMRLQSELILINCVASPISIKSPVIMWAEPD